jgi:N-acetylneuraminic acid mutarotase
MWTPVNTTYEYDPAKHEWTEKAPMPTERGALAASVIDNKIYVVGGANRKIFSLVNTPALEVYDPFKNTWKKLAPLPTPRDHLTASSLNGKLYALGGRIDVDYHDNLDANEVYDPKTNRWAKQAPLPTKRSGITSQVLDKRILVFGGESGEGTFTENEAYDPKTDSWETLTPMPEGRHGLGSARYKKKIHLFAGGPNPGGGGSDTHTIFNIDKK